MTDWSDERKARTEEFLRVRGGTIPAQAEADIRAALEEIERRGLQYPDDLGISRDAAGLSARCAELRDRLVAQGKRAEAAEARLAEAEHHHADYHAICSARNDTCPQEAEVERLRDLGRAYEADPINSSDRSSSWLKLDALLAALRGEK